MPRHRILIARAIAPQVVDFLREHFEVQDNQADVAWDAEALVARSQGKDGRYPACGCGLAGSLPPAQGGG